MSSELFLDGGTKGSHRGLRSHEEDYTCLCWLSRWKESCKKEYWRLLELVCSSCWLPARADSLTRTTTVTELCSQWTMLNYVWQWMFLEFQSLHVKAQPGKHLDIYLVRPWVKYPVKLVWTTDLPNCDIINGCYFKPLSL